MSMGSGSSRVPSKEEESGTDRGYKKRRVVQVSANSSWDLCRRFATACNTMACSTMACSTMAYSVVL